MKGNFLRSSTTLFVSLTFYSKGIALPALMYSDVIETRQAMSSKRGLSRKKSSHLLRLQASGYILIVDSLRGSMD